MPEISERLIDRLSLKGPKRILSLDGGGIRGAITVGLLEGIENFLAERHSRNGIIEKEKFRLFHYFDLIGGTSTGSIIASLLAVKGLSASEVKQLYLTLGKNIFSDKNGLNFFGKRIYTNRKYNADPLKAELDRIFGDARLGDSTNKTGLCIVTKRLDTCSTWPVTNNPAAKYFGVNRFFIKDIVRASTAAPSYFEPEVIDVGGGENGIFVDGGLSMMNNPSLQLFMVATLTGFKFHWETGDDKMFIVSVGTGRRSKRLEGKKWKDPNLLDIAKLAPDQLMTDANELVETMMQMIGHGTGPSRKIDSEIEELGNDALNSNKAFSYLRYNVDLTKNTLDSLGITNLDDETIGSLIEMDYVENLETLIAIGNAAAKEYVNEKHFPVIFDLNRVDA